VVCLRDTHANIERSENHSMFRVNIFCSNWAIWGMLLPLHHVLGLLTFSVPIFVPRTKVIHVPSNIGPYILLLKCFPSRVHALWYLCPVLVPILLFICENIFLSLTLGRQCLGVGGASCLVHLPSDFIYLKLIKLLPELQMLPTICLKEILPVLLLFVWGCCLWQSWYRVLYQNLKETILFVEFYILIWIRYIYL